VNPAAQIRRALISVRHSAPGKPSTYYAALISSPPGSAELGIIVQCTKFGLCQMFGAFQKWTDESERLSKEGLDAALRSYGELNKGFQASLPKGSRWPVWFTLRNGRLKRSLNHSRKGARRFAICRAISLSRGTQSSFPQIIIRTM
jgi:hypothetical protein